MEPVAEGQQAKHMVRKYLGPPHGTSHIPLEAENHRNATLPKLPLSALLVLGVEGILWFSYTSILAHDHRPLSTTERPTGQIWKAKKATQLTFSAAATIQLGILPQTVIRSSYPSSQSFRFPICSYSTSDMDHAFRFILEEPNSGPSKGHNNRKRARLVTACDNW